MADKKRERALALALLAAWGSGYLAHMGGDNFTAVLLGGENRSVSADFFSDQKHNFPGVSIFFACAGVNNQTKKKK